MSRRVKLATAICGATLGVPLVLAGLANLLRWEGLAESLFWLSILTAFGISHALVGLHLPARRNGVSA